MRHALAVALFVLAAVPLIAQEEYEQVMLPIAPSVVACGYHSQYDTRLLVFNDNDRAVDRICTDDESCRALAPKTAVEVTGPDAGGLPLPTFLYLPKSAAAGLRMSLVVESRNREHPEERSYTEIPVVRASDFRSDHLNFFLRMEPGFRQTVRIYGLDGHAYAQVKMRVYSLEGGYPQSYWLHELYPVGPWANAEGLQAGPSFGMECDLSEYIPADGRQVRIELTPVTPGKYWGFLSVTNNKTQHFYTVLPR